MAKRRKSGPKGMSIEQSKEAPTPLTKLKEQFQAYVEQKSYTQALTRLQQIQRLDPQATLKPSEAELYSLKGQEAFESRQYAQAEKALKKALELGLDNEAHYWLAKTLLALDRLDEALELLQIAFNNKILSKDYAGCYLKLLFLKGEVQTVEELIAQKSKFYAPQLHWARGMLALKSGELQDARTHFEKMGRPATPGDAPTAWEIYAQQQLGEWDQLPDLIKRVPVPSLFGSPLVPSLPEHPALQRLTLVVAIQTGKPPLNDIIDGIDENFSKPEALLLLQMLHLIDRGDYHGAAYCFGQLNSTYQKSPELQSLVRPLMLLAGEQAFKDDELEDAVSLWSPLLKQKPFDPKLALKLQQVLDFKSSHRERQRILNQLIDWVKQEARQNPQTWPEQNLNPVLAKLHCLLADTLIANNQRKKAIKTLQESERLNPNAPDLVGRWGLIAYGEDRWEEAIPLLRQALEGGCEYEEVYGSLLNILGERGESKKRAELRRQFGKTFGDFQIEEDLALPVWVEVFSARSYALFSELAFRKADESALRACQIFVNTSEDEPSSSDRVELQQDRADRRWTELLKPLTDQERIPVLQAIVLCIHRYAKRKKGITGLLKSYMQNLKDLSEQYVEAQVAHLILQVVKESKLEKVQSDVQNYLDQQPQPGVALAQLQIQVRHFGSTRILEPMLETALAREPQNPQLLLAKATLFHYQSSDYIELRDQGFELARRLQDAQALQMFREEDSYVATLMTEAIIPDILFGGGSLDPKDMLRRIARQALGEEVPPEIIDAMLPEFEKMMGGFPDFDEDEDDSFNFSFDPFGTDLPFGKQKSKSKSRPKRGFQ